MEEFSGSLGGRGFVVALRGSRRRFEEEVRRLEEERKEDLGRGVVSGLDKTICGSSSSSSSS